MRPLTSSEKRIRIAYFTTGWPPEVGGPSSGNFDRVRNLSQYSDIDIHVIAPEYDSRIVADIPNATIHTYEAKPWRVYPLFRVPTLRGGCQIDNIISALTPDVVFNTDIERGTFLSSWRQPGRTWATKSKTPYLGYYHTNFYGFAKSYRGWNKLTDLAVLPALRKLYSTPDVIIAASETAQREAEKLHARKVEHLPCDGVDTQFFTPEHRDRTWLSSIIPQLLPKDRVVLSLGRIAPEKHIDQTLNAFEHVFRQESPTQRQHLWLLVAGQGDPSLEKKLKNHANRLTSKHQIIFHGFVHGVDRAKILASADVFTLPSTHETFSITTTEAMACATPVACARSGAMPTYISDGVTGFLHSPLDPADQARAIHNALAADREKIGHAARDVVIQRFSHHNISAQLREIFHREVNRTTQ